VAVSNHGSASRNSFAARFSRNLPRPILPTPQKRWDRLGSFHYQGDGRANGGSIGFDSQPDVLTTFFVEFPIWQERLPSRLRRWMLREKAVLICEDDRDIAALLRMMLEQAGLAVDIAYNAGQAKQLLAQGSYAAMTLDLELPDQDGVALIRELRDAKQTAALPIVVISANAIEGARSWAARRSV